MLGLVCTKPKFATKGHNALFCIGTFEYTTIFIDELLKFNFGYLFVTLHSLAWRTSILDKFNVDEIKLIWSN